MTSNAFEADLPGASANAARSDRIPQRLRELYTARQARDDAEAVSKRAADYYREVESEVIDMLQATGVTSMRVEGCGNFCLGGRTYPRVSDMQLFVEYAELHGLIEAFREPEGGDWSDLELLSFKAIEEQDSKGQPRIVLTNGVARLEISKAPLGEHCKELIGAGEPLPPGVEMAITPYITIRR